MTKKVRVAVIDDHPMVRRGVTETLSEEKDFEVIAEGATACDAIRVVSSARPDLVVLDASMPGDGVEAARQITREHPNTQIVMLTIREDAATVRAALKAGARGYIAKGVDADELVSSLRRVVGGERIVSPGLAARLFLEDEPLRSRPPAQDKETQVELLTERERQILNLLSKGFSNEEIAVETGLRANTVKHYLTPLFKKLGVRNRTEAALLGPLPTQR